MKHRSLIPVTLLALLAIGCETAELGPKPVWAGGDAPTLADTGLPDISSGDSAAETDSTVTTPDVETTPDVSAGDTTVIPETSSDAEITVDADASSDAEITVDADATQDAAPSADADATQDAAPSADADATEDAALLDVSSDLPSEDLAQADVPGCDPESDPTCAGALAPTWQLENVAQATVGFGETYGLEAYTGTVTVLALLTGG